MTKCDMSACGAEAVPGRFADLCREHWADFAAWKARQPQPKYPDDYVRADTPSGFVLRPGWEQRALERQGLAG